jgi:FMN-dependent oxidoreductase (nitrilotriacetate monooxygenase family)
MSGEENFSQTLPDHDARYHRAREYLEVVTGLWNCWEESAAVNDRENGHWAVPERIHPLNHTGGYFMVKGPLISARSPQGWPVLVQAGASESGMDFAASFAEVLFTAQPTLASAQRTYSAVKDLARQRGRDPELMKVMPGILPIIGDTPAEAKEIAHELSEFLDLDTSRRDVQAFMVDLAGIEGFDCDDIDLDEPIPTDRLVDPDKVHRYRSRYEIYYGLVQKKYTLRQIIQIVGSGQGHPVVVGTPEHIAGVMQTWFDERGCDGFQLQVSHYFNGLDAVTDKLVPILQERGLFHDAYPGTTLRESYGLPRPASR